MTDQPAVHAALTCSDEQMIEALRAGDETAFVALVDLYHAAMVRLALQYVRDLRTAEDVVQETWLDVLQGIGRFGARCSLKTWIFRILTNTAKTRGVREGRMIPFSVIWETEAETGEPSIDPECFGPTGHWVPLPDTSIGAVEDHVAALEMRAYVQNAIDGLPTSQRIVISLRDVEGWSAAEAGKVLGLSDANQRVLLHRARSKVRAALEEYLRPHE